MSIKLSVLVIVEPDGSGFHAFTPALKGLHVDGETQERAVENAREAILAYLDSLSEHGDPIPVGPGLTLEKSLDIPKISASALLENVVVPWAYQ